MKLRMPALRFKKPSKKQGLLLAAVLLSLVVIAYAIGSVRAWDGVATSRASYYEETKNRVQAALHLPVTTVAERMQKVDTLETIVTDHARISNSSCRPHPVIAWQAALVSSYKERVGDCEEEYRRIGVFMDDLNDVVGFLKNERVISDAFTEVKGENTVISEDQWQANLASWQKVQATLEKVVSSPGFEAVKVKALDASKGVIAAWQELIDANAAKDHSRYEKALSALGAAYDGLESVGASTETAIEPLLADAAKAYQAAFPNT